MAGNSWPRGVPQVKPGALSPEAETIVALALGQGNGPAGKALRAVNHDLSAALGQARFLGFQWEELRLAARKLAERMAALGGRIEVVTAPTFPAELKAISDPPAFLYCLGPLPLTSCAAVAVIGSRRPTGYGLAQAERLGGELASAGAVVVSGMALGIDGAAHRGALAAGGHTIAVLGTGINRIYPASHRALYCEIARRGLLVSEFPLDAGARREHFPVRNRLISGLSRAVVVVEARVQSGTNHTVRCAVDQGRSVCAMPGPVTSPLSAGPHRWIRENHLALVCDAQDIFHAMNIELLPNAGRQFGVPLPADPRAIRVLEALAREPLAAEELATRVQLPPWTLASLLSMLEMGGFVIRRPDGIYLANPIYTEPQPGPAGVPGPVGANTKS